MIGLVVAATRAAPIVSDDLAPVAPMPPSEYSVAAENSLQGLFLEMLEHEDTDGGDSHYADVRSKEAESALRARYDREVAELLATNGRWALSQRNDLSDKFIPQYAEDESRMAMRGPCMHPAGKMTLTEFTADH